MNSEIKLENYDSDTDNSELETDLVLDKVVNRLTEIVRKQYCSYMEKLLIENYKNWCLQTMGNLENPPDVWIKRCVKFYEENAVRSCMIVQFYRQSMLKTMAKIRKSTINGKLADKIKKYSIKDETEDEVDVKYISVGTQTKNMVQHNLIDTTSTHLQQNQKNLNPKIKNSSKDIYYKKLSLDEKLSLFRKRLKNVDLSEECKRKRITSPNFDNLAEPDSFCLSHDISTVKMKIDLDNTESTFPQQKIPRNLVEIKKEKINYINIEKELDEIFEQKEDDIAKELDKIFEDEQNELDEILGNSFITEDPNIDNILREIECSALPSPQKIFDRDKVLDESIIKNDLKMENKIIRNKITDDEILKNSLWPCELHMRRQKLQDILSKIGEEFGMRCHENLKIKFIELFGEDDDAEFAPYSPTLELDEVLLSSCKKRIASWIVKYLMIPMNEGKIGDRLLFKKFAKKIAHKIILEDQYPSEQYVKATVEHYFVIHRAVMSIEEIKI